MAQAAQHPDHLPPRPDKARTNDPIRLVWRAYCGRVTLEGALMILAGMLALVGIDNLVLLFTGYDLGYWLLIPVAGLGYFAFIGVFRPLIFYARAFETPRTRELVKVLPLVIPALAGKESTTDEMRKVLREQPPGRYLSTNRLVRNGIILLLALLLFLAPFLL